MRKYRLKRNHTQLGEYLLKQRKAAGLTQKELSETLGYSSAQFISNFERGITAPPLSKMDKIVKTLKIKQGDLDSLVSFYVTAYEKKIAKAIKGK